MISWKRRGKYKDLTPSFSNQKPHVATWSSNDHMSKEHIRLMCYHIKKKNPWPKLKMHNSLHIRTFPKCWVCLNDSGLRFPPWFRGIFIFERQIICSEACFSLFVFWNLLRCIVLWNVKILPSEQKIDSPNHILSCYPPKLPICQWNNMKVDIDKFCDRNPNWEAYSSLKQFCQLGFILMEGI